MSAIKLSTPSSGSISLSPADTASNLTITVPAVTGTMAIQGPAFSAYQSSTQTLGSATFTKILFQTEDFDTNANYDISNSRFTPTVAGYYQINATVRTNALNGELSLLIYKNGSQYYQGGNTVSSANYNQVGACLIYCNGSTDYIEIYTYTSSSISSSGATFSTRFNGFLARSA
jgi:hypothetical protein